MQGEKIFNAIDKSAWGIGPWQNEPDKMQWTDPETGLVCLIVRHSDNGHLCGYVGVPEGHPAYGQPYEAVSVDVHGGLTFAGPCQDGPEPRVCHAPAPGEPDAVWWLGFDCAHLFDVSPGEESLKRSLKLPPRIKSPFFPACVYRNVDYVRNECKCLAAHIKNWTPETRQA